LCFHPALVGCRLCVVGLISSVVVSHLYLYVTFNFQSVVIFVFCFQSVVREFKWATWIFLFSVCGHEISA
jgi:uncharacterized membrane protein